jgi:hypothetical protein
VRDDRGADCSWRDPKSSTIPPIETGNAATSKRHQHLSQERPTIGINELRFPIIFKLIQTCGHQPATRCASPMPSAMLWRHSPSPSLTCAIRSPPGRVASQPITRHQLLRGHGGIPSIHGPGRSGIIVTRGKCMTENAAVVVGVDGSEGSRAALRWSALEAHRRQLPLRIVAAAGLDAVMPATASESFWRHLSAYRSRHPTTPRCSSSVPVAAAGSPDCSSVRSATLCCTVHTARSP